MKSTVGKLLLVLGIAALGAWGVTKTITARRVEAERKQAERQKRGQTRQAIAAMVAKHNAASDWKDGLDAGPLGGTVYSVEVERTLLKGGQPVLIFGSVEDISRRGENYTVHMRDMFSPGPDIRFLLESDANHVKTILDQPQESDMRFLRRFAAIAVITSIRRPIFDLRGESEGEEGSRVSLDSSDVFIATGRCLDVLDIGDYELGEESAHRGD